jgi:L,D-transpeptidase catalytic domain
VAGSIDLKYLTVAVAVLVLLGSALTSLAHAQGGGVASAAPSSITGSPTAAASTPTATAMPHPTATSTAAPAAANNPAPLSPIDHAVWVATRPPDLMPGDHVLILQPAPVATPLTPAAAASPRAIPQSASRPEARATPGIGPVAAPSAPAAQPQPVAARTPGVSTAVANNVPAPAATPKLSPIDHELIVTAHPSGSSGAPPSIDHEMPSHLDGLSVDSWTPGRELLASLRLPQGEHLTEGEQVLMETRDDSCREPISWSVIVHKSAYLIEVYYKGRLFGSFPAVFGRNPDHSAKLWEGDLKTPEGTYVIIEKYYNPRWRWFLRLNYPNFEDRNRWDSMRDEGLVPVVAGHLRPLGGSIGIHGTDRPRFNRLRVNWTLGCISVDNDAIEELDRILPVGTMVIIKP